MQSRAYNNQPYLSEISVICHRMTIELEESFGVHMQSILALIAAVAARLFAL